MTDTKRSIRRLLSLLLCAAVLAMPAYAAKKTEEEEEIGGDLAEDLQGNIVGTEGGTYAEFDDSMLEADVRIGYTAQPSSILNPYFNTENDYISLNQLVFEPMVSLDDEQKPVPMLADTWEHTDTEWTFHLRSGVKFHDGTEMTAYDVEASYNQCLKAPELNSYAVRLTQWVQSLTAVDENTVSVVSTYTGYMTLYAMNFPVVQASTVDYDLPNGTGPFKYVSFKASYAIRLERNEYWWQKSPTIDSITFIYYENASAEIEALETKDIDMLATRSIKASLSRKLSDLVSMDFGTTVYDALVPNLSDDSLASDVNVRKAIMYAIDRSELASNVYRDMAVQSEVPILPGTWLYESQSAVYNYSPERALQLLYESGWQDLTGNIVLNKLKGIQLVELRLTLITYNDGTNTIRESAANLIAEYLAAVGIRVDVEVLSKESCQRRIKSDEYDLALVSYNLSEVPDFTQMFGKSGTVNFNGYGNSQMRTLVEQSLAAQDEDTLKQIYSDIQIKIVNDLPIMGLLFRSGTVLSTRRLDSLAGLRAMSMYRGIEYLTN